MAAGDYAFGSFLLNDNVVYFVTNAQPTAAPIDLNRVAYGTREGSALIYQRFREHIVRIVGLMYGANAADAESKKDDFIKAMLNGEQNLKWGYQDERYYKARLTGEILVFAQSSLVYEYEAQFVVLDPFAYAALASSDTPGLVIFA